MALGAGVLAVGALVLYVGAGGLSFIAGSISSTISTFVSGVTATPIPSVLPASVPDAPTIESPAEPYTNQSQVDLSVTVPSRLAGDPDYVVRIYLALKDQSPAPIDETPLAPTPQIGVVPARTLGARHGRAEDHPHLAQGRGGDQPRGGNDPGPYPGPLDDQRPQRQDG